MSPTSKDDIRRDGTLITLGSPAYNLVSQAVEDDFAAPIRFINDNAALATRDHTVVGGSPTHGVAQRVVHPTTGQVAFYLAGPSRSATNAAVRHLLQDWRQLAKRHPNEQFYEVLRAAAREGGSIVVSAIHPPPQGSRWRR